MNEVIMYDPFSAYNDFIVEKKTGQTWSKTQHVNVIALTQKSLGPWSLPSQVPIA